MAGPIRPAPEAADLHGFRYWDHFHGLFDSLRTCAIEGEGEKKPRADPVLHTVSANGSFSTEVPNKNSSSHRVDSPPVGAPPSAAADRAGFVPGNTIGSETSRPPSPWS